MLRSLLLISLFISLYSCQQENVVSIESMLKSSAHPIVEKVINDTEKYELQIRYTSIDRSKSKPLFTHHDYLIDSTKYFYPASTVKMPTAFVAIEYINELSNLNIPIDLYTDMRIDSSRTPQSAQSTDSCTISGKPSIAGFVKEIFAISDNEAYNRLYSFVGQRLLNDKLYGNGAFTNSRIQSRVGVGGFSLEENSYSNPIKFFNGDTLLYSILESQQKYKDNINIRDCIKGKGYIDQNDSLVMLPFNMCNKNFISVEDLERSIMRVIDQDAFGKMEKFRMSKENRNYLLKCMKTLPKAVPCYQNNPEYTDNYCKFLLYGETNDIPDHIEIYNKIGQAYGYLTDCAYIKDTKNDIDFYLTCTMSVNENEIYNDGVYEYGEIGYPFMAELGRIIYSHELSLKSKK